MNWNRQQDCPNKQKVTTCIQHSCLEDYKQILVGQLKPICPTTYHIQLVGNFCHLRTINFTVFKDLTTASKINSLKSYYNIESYDSLVDFQNLICKVYHGEIISVSKIVHHNYGTRMRVQILCVHVHDRICNYIHACIATIHHTYHMSVPFKLCVICTVCICLYLKIICSWYSYLVASYCICSWINISYTL